MSETLQERFTAPYPPYDPTDPKGFSYETVVKRWPIIITNVIDTINNENHRLHMNSGPNCAEKIAEGNAIISSASKLKYEMARDKVMHSIVDDGTPDTAEYNRELGHLAEKGLNSWFKAPWLYAECYLYRVIRTWFASTQYWRDFDPFFRQKEDSFKSSGAAVYELAQTILKLDEEHQLLDHDEGKLEILWGEMIQMCLWGNATDLSLLTNLSHEDIQALQTVDKDAQSKRKEFVLKDDSKAAWQHLKHNSGRVDFVLDNAGFELYTDLLFADFLVSHTGLVTEVVFHPKTIPWFVSDVLPPDLKALFSALQDPSYFSSFLDPIAVSERSFQVLHALAQKWHTYFATSKFRLSVPCDLPLGTSSGASFWTSPHAYWNMHLDDPSLLSELRKSSLVIFKGDLNFRKLTGDIKWPISTPFEVAIGPLNGQFPILSLRTNKADVAVGVPEDVATVVEAKDPKWRVNGKYALISFASTPV